MPMYRYVCDNCGSETVVFHPMTEDPEIVCENCGNVMRRTIGRVGVIFKGSGFYTTDSRKNNGSREKVKSESEKEEAKV